jgi:glycosyltransferase involved in cell wall biosynthesis
MNISIVIPAYNEEKYLPKTLASIKKLETKPAEVIVIDSGSTDKTALIAHSFGVKVIDVPKRGIGLARQTGLLSAKGPIIAFTDADTVVPPNWLTIIEKTLSEPGVAGVVGSFLVSDGPFPYRFHSNCLQSSLMEFMYHLGLPTAAGQNMAFYKDAALKAGGFPSNFKMVEDNEMYRRLKTQGIVRFRRDLLVTSSGRRGREGLLLPIRYFVAFIFYFLLGRGDIIGFKDFR